MECSADVFFFGWTPIWEYSFFYNNLMFYIESRMWELTLLLTISSGPEDAETFQEKWELEFQEPRTKKMMPRKNSTVPSNFLR